MNLEALFQAPRLVVSEEVKGAEIEVEEEKGHKVVFEDPNIRNKRTIFVGNVPLECEKSKIEKLFKKAGTVEKIWVRSVPIDESVKMSIKAKVILGKHNQNSLNKNCYVLYTTEESA